jgi:hypothetical protein
MELGIIWRYKQARGLDWQTDYDKYMYQVQQGLAQDQPRNTINMTGESMIPSGVPGLIVPEGNWNLP